MKHARWRLLAGTLIVTLASVGWLISGPDVEHDAVASKGVETTVEPWALEGRGVRSHPDREKASGIEQLPQDLVHALRLFPAGEAADGSELALPLPGRPPLNVRVHGSITHANGDRTLHASGSGRVPERVTLTYGADGLFARINSADGLYLVVTDATGTWLVDTGDERLSVDNFGADTLGASVSDSPASQDPHSASNAQTSEPPAPTSEADPERIDVMFIYPDTMQDRYPGSLLETRLNHLVAIANQAMVDSHIDVVVRLVHHQRTGYSRHQQNSQALRDLARALDGESVPGLQGLASSRRNQGADIVALTWPHDIEVRGSCGMAFFPQIDDDGNADSSFGVHIDNDGVSNWSICSDSVFTHELGHNLGARHQRSSYSESDPQADNFAFVRDGRFHTVMGSFGTGHDHRYWRLDVYSNPDIQCGGVTCGSTVPGEAANNARRLGELAPVVAGYVNPVSTASVDRPGPSAEDRDGDGVSDWDDPYPFDPFDGEAPPESGPPLVFSERTLRQPIDRGDWELLVVDSAGDQVLSYSLDGRLRAVVARPEAVNQGPVLSEYSDLDVDERGQLYLLANSDVRRFDRLSGRLVDVFLSSRRPQPAELGSAFPRALGWIPGEQLVVLGDNAIERYDPAGNRLGTLLDADEPSQNPNSWDSVMDLPLRAFAHRDRTLYVAEARSNRIMAFNDLNGFRKADVAGPDNGTITDPWDLAFGPDDGLLYVANGRGNNVLRYDVESRSLVDEFIAPGAGGLDFARSLAFGPGGDLYVISRGNGEILRFDASSGNLVETVVHAGEGGLETPENLRLAPVLDEIHAGHSGHYFVPSRSGEGWLLEILDDSQAVMSWFTYPPAAEPTAEQAWAIGVGDISGNRIVFDDFTATRMVDPSSGIEPGDVELLEWGRMEFEFSNCSHGQATFDSTLFGQSGELDFVRLGGIVGLPCGSVSLNPSPAAPGISGQWYDPGLSGQGWYLQETRAGRVFAAWFTYDALGEQSWIVGEGELDGATLHFDELLMTRGAAFGADFDPQQIEHISWGTMTFRFNDCDRAELDYDSVLAEFGSGTLFPERLTRLQQLDCQLPGQ